MSKAKSKKKVTKAKSSPKKSLKSFKIKFEKPTWAGIKESKITRYSLLVLAILVCFVIVDFGVQYLNNDYSAVVVNGVRISRKEYYYRLDQAYGSSISAQLIQEELVRQEALTENVVVSEEEVQEEIDKIAEQLGGSDQLDISLEAYNLTIEDLKEQIKIDLLANKILEPGIEYSEEDVKAFFEQYSNVIFAEEASALEEGELLDYDTFREKTLEIYLQQEVESAKSTWLMELEGSAKIQNNAVDRPEYEILGATRNIVTNIIDEANTNNEIKEVIIEE
ncbi:SurA N-terminal domain-containing protein [bacterium]|nr:SurA N-terminal domain-containing protein [bacterium]